jgi:hypothetical protein
MLLSILIPLVACAQANKVGFKESPISETWTRFVPVGNESVSAYGIADIVEHEGAIWIGTERRGLWRYRQGRFENLSGRLHASSVRSIFKDSNGALWFCYDQWGGHENASSAERAGIAEYQDGKWHQFDIPPELIGSKALQLNDVHAARGGVFFVFTWGRVLQFRLGTWSLVPDVQSPRDFLEARDGTIWITGRVGARIWTERPGEGIRPVQANGAVNFGSPTTLAETPDGTIWIGDSESGLVSFRGSRFRRVRGDGFFYQPDWAMRDGTLLVGNAWHHLRPYKDGNWLESGESKDWKFAGPVLETTSGVVWYGGAGRECLDGDDKPCEKGLAYYEQGIWKRFIEIAPNVFPDVTSLHEGSDGSIWASVNNDRGRCGGLCSGLIARYSRGEWHIERRARGTTLVNAWHNASNGSLWLGMTNGELRRFSPSRATLTVARVGQSVNLILRVAEGHTDPSAWVLRFGFSASDGSSPVTWFETHPQRTGELAVPLPVTSETVCLHASAMDPDGTPVDLSRDGKTGPILISSHAAEQSDCH